VDPSFKVVARAYPHVIGQLLRDRSPEMRQILGSLIVDPSGQIRWSRLEKMIRAAAESTDNLHSGKHKHHGNGSGDFSPEFSVDIAAAFSDALSLVCLPENGRMRRVLIQDGSLALDRMIDEVLTGSRRRGLNNEDRHRRKQDLPPPQPDALASLAEKFASLINAAPGPWAKLAVETASSKEGFQFCSQLSRQVIGKSSWRGGQWMIFAAGNLLHEEHVSWKQSKGSVSDVDDEVVPPTSTK
jgi:hypothetical protein